MRVFACPGCQQLAFFANTACLRCGTRFGFDLAESDDIHRERLRTTLSEPYRTVLGHLRREIGHFLFIVLGVRAADRADVRALVGDETLDSPAALDRHYRDGPPADGGDRHVREYATMHPAEDWAETPFVLSPAVMAKRSDVHEVVVRAAGRGGQVA